MKAEIECKSCGKFTPEATKLEPYCDNCYDAMDDERFNEYRD